MGRQTGDAGDCPRVLCAERRFRAVLPGGGKKTSEYVVRHILTPGILLFRNVFFRADHSGALVEAANLDCVSKMRPKALECGGKTPLCRASKRCHGTALQGAPRTNVEKLASHAL